MAVILSIETATEVCSVAVSRDSEILAFRETTGSNEHSALLTVFIDETVREAGIQLSGLDAVAVSMGPGSYTGLRIGVSAAKGLCFALDKPMIAVSTLKAMAMQATRIFTAEKALAPETLICPMIDARRMEVFSAIYDQQLNLIEPVEARILDQETFGHFTGMNIAIVGNGAAKCRELYENQPGILFPGILLPSATAIAVLAHEKYRQSDFADTAYFEPYYLKDFIAGKPKVKGLRD